MEDALLAPGGVWCAGLAGAREALAGVWPEGDPPFRLQDPV